MSNRYRTVFDEKYKGAVMTVVYTHEQEGDIERLLVGHSVKKIADNMLELNDGRKLRLVGNNGGWYGTGYTIHIAD